MADAEHVHECFASTTACGNLTSNVGCKLFPKSCKSHWQFEQVQLPTACHRAAGRHTATNEVIVPTRAFNAPYHACYANGLARSLTSRVGCRRHSSWRGQSRAATAAAGLRHSIEPWSGGPRANSSKMNCVVRRSCAASWSDQVTKTL